MATVMNGTQAHMFLEEELHEWKYALTGDHPHTSTHREEESDSQEER